MSLTDQSNDPQFLRILEELRNRYMRRPATVDRDTTLGPRHGEVRVDASGATRTITLPPTSDAIAREYTIKKIDSSTNAVTVQRQASSGDTIDGSTSLNLVAQYDSVTVKSDGEGKWDIIARVGSGAGGWSAVKKTADEAVTSDTTLTADGELVVPLEAGAKYHIRGRIFLYGAATGNYKYGLSYTGTLADTFWHRRHSALGAALGTDNESSSTGRGSLPSSTSVT